MPAHPTSPSDPNAAILATYAINDAMNQLLLAHLDPEAWRANPLGTAKSSKKNGRTIGAIFAHMHNVRLKWLRASAPHLKRPEYLDPYRCTQKQAASAHKKSAAQCLRMLTDVSSNHPKRRIPNFVRDSWMPVWPANPNTVAYMFAHMFAHEAHHRGQITMLAHQLGYRLPAAAWGGLWQWDKLWKQAGFTNHLRSRQKKNLSF